MNQERPVVAILNSSYEITELLHELLADHGFEPVSAYTVEFKHGLKNIQRFCEQYRPQAIIYDIAVPYVENWQFFLDQVLNPQLLPRHCIVLTTTNKAALESLVGPTPAFELIGKPYDLDLITQAVQRAVEHYQATPSTGTPAEK